MTAASSSSPATGRSELSRTWPTIAALVMMWIASLAEQYWFFGLLFLAWAGWDIYSGESNFLQRITRGDSPVTFWLVQISWIGFGLAWISTG